MDNGFDIVNLVLERLTAIEHTLNEIRTLIARQDEEERKPETKDGTNQDLFKFIKSMGNIGISAIAIFYAISQICG